MSQEETGSRGLAPTPDGHHLHRAYPAEEERIAIAERIVTRPLARPSARAS